MDELEPPVADHARSVIVLSAFAVEVLARPGADHRQIIYRVWHADSAEIEKCRHHAGKTDQAIIERPLRHSRVALVGHQDHQATGRAILEGPPGDYSVVSGHVAVVAGEHDDDIVEQPFKAKSADQIANLVVDLGA